MRMDACTCLLLFSEAETGRLRVSLKSMMLIWGGLNCSKMCSFCQLRLPGNDCRFEVWVIFRGYWLVLLGSAAQCIRGESRLHALVMWVQLTSLLLLHEFQCFHHLLFGPAQLCWVEENGLLNFSLASSRNRNFNICTLVRWRVRCLLLRL